MKKTFLVQCVFLLLLILLISCSPIAQSSAPTREGNQPLFLQGESDTAVVLFHGLSASPFEVQTIAQVLAQKNFTVSVPLLKRHGSSVDDLRGVHWEEWHIQALQAYDSLAERYAHVYVGGISFGATLALLIASERDTAGVIAISPPVWFQDDRARFAFLAQYFMSDAQHELFAFEQPYYYRTIPVSSIFQITLSIQSMVRSLAEVHEPVLILQDEFDRTIKPESAEFIFRKLTSTKDKQIVWFTSGYHVITTGPQQDTAKRKIAEFIERTSK